MKIHWTPEAIQNLNKIYTYYFSQSPKVAGRIYNQIIDEVDILISFPCIAKIEPLLADETEIYRSLIIRRNFKIIYHLEADNVHIISIWDCRQNPDILSDIIHKKRDESV